jgi:uncharacterized membrane protein
LDEHIKLPIIDGAVFRPEATAAILLVSHGCFRRTQPCARIFGTMSPITRRVAQALLYETVAIVVVGPALSFAFDEPPASTFGLAVVLSTVALTWNYAFNWIFERWEARQAVRGRSVARRLAHGVGFEGGLVFILVPVMSFWLDISLAAAFLANLALLAFFFVYAIAFTWAFDRIFGLPASARKKDAESIDA